MSTAASEYHKRQAQWDKIREGSGSYSRALEHSWRDHINAQAPAAIEELERELAEERERADFFHVAYEERVAQLHRLHENRQNLAVRIATEKMAGTNSLWAASEVLRVIGEELDKPTKEES